MSERADILVVEDEAQIARFIASSLTLAGHAPRLAGSLAQAEAAVVIQRPQLVVLDLGLPDGDGRSLIASLRARWDLPILILSARQAEQEKVECLDLGADDYLEKPFGVAELQARVRAALRRAARMRLRDDVYVLEGLRIDLGDQRVTLDGQPVHLTPIEYRLLSTLAASPGKVLGHRQLLAEVWGAEYVGETHYLRIHMGRLRAKLEAHPAEPRYLLTEAGVGYRLAV